MDENGSGAHKVPVKRVGPGTVLADRYKLIKKIGEGGMAKVYRAAVIGTSRMGAFIDNEIPLVVVSKGQTYDRERWAPIAERPPNDLICCSIS